MAKRNKGDGVYNVPVKLNEGPGDTPEAKHGDYSKIVYADLPKNNALPKTGRK